MPFVLLLHLLTQEWFWWVAFILLGLGWMAVKAVQVASNPYVQAGAKFGAGFFK